MLQLTFNGVDKKKKKYNIRRIRTQDEKNFEFTARFCWNLRIFYDGSAVNSTFHTGSTEDEIAKNRERKNWKEEDRYVYKVVWSYLFLYHVPTANIIYLLTRQKNSCSTHV